MAKTIYLAGPDVFLPNAIEVGALKKELCSAAGFEGLFPLDNEVEADASAIFAANRALMDRAEIGFFNLTPFRGPSADAGTVFELGYMAAQGKPLYGYSAVSAPYLQRVQETLDVELAGDQYLDPLGYSIEDFGLRDNLMIGCSIRQSNGVFLAEADNVADESDPLAAMAAFKGCLKKVTI